MIPRSPSTRASGLCVAVQRAQHGLESSSAESDVRPPFASETLTTTLPSSQQRDARRWQGLGCATMSEPVLQTLRLIADVDPDAPAVITDERSFTWDERATATALHYWSSSSMRPRAALMSSSKRFRISKMEEFSSAATRASGVPSRVAVYARSTMMYHSPVTSSCST